MRFIKFTFLTCFFLFINDSFSQEVKRLYTGDRGEIKMETVRLEKTSAFKAKELRITYMEFVSAINLNNVELKKVKNSSLNYEEKRKKARLLESEIKKFKKKYCDFFSQNVIKDKEAIALYREYSKDI